MHAELSGCPTVGPAPVGGPRPELQPAGMGHERRTAVESRSSGTRGAESDRSRKVMLVQVWDIATRKRAGCLTRSRTTVAGDDLFADYDLSFSRDGKRLGITADAWVARPSRVRSRAASRGR